VKGGRKGEEEEGRGNADWQSAQYKESNGGKNATEGNKEDGGEDGGAVSKFDLDAINKEKFARIKKKQYFCALFRVWGKSLKKRKCGRTATDVA